MSMRNLVQEFPEFWSIDKIAIVRKADAVRAVDVKGLGFGTGAFWTSIVSAFVFSITHNGERATYLCLQ